MTVLDIGMGWTQENQILLPSDCIIIHNVNIPYIYEVFKNM